MSRSPGHDRWLIALLVALACAGGQRARALEATGEPAEAVLEVTVNDQKSSEMMVVLRDAANHLWLTQSDLQKLRLRVPDAASRLYDDRRYFALDDIPGSSVVIDDTMQRATVQVPAKAFEPTRVSAAGRGAPALTPTAPGAFLNYQLSAQHISGDTVSGAYGELGLFAGPGVLTNTGVVRSVSGDAAAVRLDSTFTKDFPSRMVRLSVGDSITDAASWGNAVRFGGVRWGTDFGLRPDLLTTPLLAASGEAVVPSTVDVFVNNQRVSSEDLPPGPFVIDRLPAITGAGEVRVVVRDALGREQVLNQAFYSSQSLLAPGLSQYSVDLGAIRENYAIHSDDYGSLTGAADYRRGLTARLTMEAHGEFLLHDAHSFGAGLAAQVGTLGVLSVSAASGGDDNTTGWLGGVGFEHHGTRFSTLLSATSATVGYRQVGDSITPDSRYRQRLLAQAGVSLDRAGSLSLAYVRQTYTSQHSMQTLSLTHSVTLRERATLAFTLSRTASDTAATSVYLGLTIPLEKQRAVDFAAFGGSGPGAPQNELYATYMQNPPIGPGSGYRLAASTAGNYDADWRRQFEAGDLELQAARNQSVDGQSAFWSGAATWMDGLFKPARTVPGSFAVVDLGGIANVPVYIDHQLITHTDDHGLALLPDLLPYEANRVNIEPEELPLDTAISERTLVLVPAYRSGVVARFPVEKIRAGTFRLVTVDGVPVPAGAMVRLKGKVFPVANDGFTYVTGYDHGLGGVAQWEGRQCRFQLEPPPEDDPQPDMGTVVCMPIATEPGGRE